MLQSVANVVAVADDVRGGALTNTTLRLCFSNVVCVGVVCLSPGTWNAMEASAMLPCHRMRDFA